MRERTLLKRGSVPLPPDDRSEIARFFLSEGATELLGGPFPVAELGQTRARSKRSRFMTLFQAATKSWANLWFASGDA
jgi:hypothetical protein